MAGSIKVDEGLSVDEALEAHKAASSSASAKAPTKGDQIKLYDPRHLSLTFGDRDSGEVIQFGQKGGFEPNVWIGPSDHPLLEELLNRYPAIFEIEEKQRVYICGECGREFNVKVALTNHQRSHKAD